MLQLDPTTTGFVAGLFAIGLAVILWISRIGLGSAAVGVRMWLLGDLVMILSRYVTTAETNAALWQPDLPPLCLNNALITAGVALHWRALQRHVRSTTHPMRDIGMSLALGLLAGGASATLESAAHRADLLHLALIVLFGMKLVTLMEPVRRFSGARVLAAAFAWGLVANTVMLVSGFEQAADGHQRSGTYLLMGATMTLITAAAFLLWLQQELRQHFMELAVTDALTGALNRHGLMPRLQEELGRAMRSGRPLSVALCDLDHFKRINDVHGHAAGDQVIKSFTDTARRHLRGHDLIGRWGGEEFLIVLPETSGKDAVSVIDRLRQLQEPAAPGLPVVTVSAGVATAPLDCGAYDIDALVQRADERAYQAKQQRNRVVGSGCALNATRAEEQPTSRLPQSPTAVASHS